MRLKSPAVSVDDIHPALIPHLFRLDDWCRDQLGYDLVITSCTDGVHSATSRHYLGTAIDIRTWTTPESGVQISNPRRAGLVAGLKAFLGRDWFPEFRSSRGVLRLLADWGVGSSIRWSEFEVELRISL